MVSITVTASFLGLAQGSSRTGRRRFVVADAAKGAEVECAKLSSESNNGRRELMFAAAAAAVCSVVGIASVAEPKPGTSEAKKVYPPVCVAMPTAKIYHK